MSGIMLNLIGSTFGLPTIGSAYGGGFFAGQINVSGTIYNLVVADKTVGETFGLTWGAYAVTVGTSSVINGPTNTSTLAALGPPYNAAIFCQDLVTGGYSDWYLPAQNELEVLYYFLKPSSTSNNTSSGSNANAVAPEPISTNYSAGSPTQTSATTFRTGASSQEFVNDYYWSSTENGSAFAWCILFSTGELVQRYKHNFLGSNYTRAVRRVLA
jgi:hypothetical protein